MGQERFDAIRLARSPRIGPVTYRQLIARFGNASEALRALPDLARRGGGKMRALADERFVSFVARVTARARVEPNLLTVVFREVVRLDGTPLATVRFARWPGGGGLNELGNPLDQVAEIGRRVARRVRPEPVGAA